MNNVIEFEVACQINGSVYLHGWRIISKGAHELYLGSERLATDPADQDLTGTFRMFNLQTAVAPGEWPNPHEGITTDDDPRHRG